MLYIKMHNASIINSHSVICRLGVGIWLLFGLLVYLFYGIHHSALNDGVRLPLL
jgi:hypothetical protein